MPKMKKPMLGALAALGVLVPGASAAVIAAESIDACGTVITTPGTYVLSQDLNCGGGFAIHVDASNVTVQLDGHTITAAESVVIGASVSVDNVVVQGPGTGTGSDNSGFVLVSATNSGFDGVTASGNRVGVATIAPASSTGNFVRNSTVTNNDTGAQLIGNGVEFSGNNCSANTNGSGQFGIEVFDSSDGNQIHHNTCNDQVWGILVYNGSNDNVIHDNTATGNAALDAFDQNPDCGTNQWYANTFGSFSPACANNAPAVVCTVTGTAGNDRLRGTSGDDVICGLGGDDVLDGRGGNDEVYGDDGNDTVIGKGGNDKLVGGAGTDLLLPGAGDDTADGGDGARDRVLFSDIKGGGVDVMLASGSVTGEAGSDVGSDTLSNIEQVFGSPFSDILVAQIAGVASTLKGGAGNDQLDVDDGDGLDTVVGNQGTDTCTISAGDQARECETGPSA
jgi:parallel beta-helix repeat protein